MFDKYLKYLIFTIGIMVETKSLEATKRKWEGAIGRVPAAYSEGVGAAKDVIAKAIAAEDLYAARMQEAISAKRRAVKLAEVTDEDWRRAAKEKGAARIGPGMSAAKDKFAKGMGRVLDTLAGVSLPPRTADPIANVDNRVKPIVAALRKLKD